jgi:hypothetical protein
MTLQQAFEAACTRFNGSNFEQLTEADRVLIAIWGLEAEVNNGGFDQYYFNSAGAHARHAPAALRRIGAQSMATIVERANSLFGAQGPPENDVARQEALFALTAVNEGPWDELDRLFFAYPDDISKLLEQYLGIAPVA